MDERSDEGSNEGGDVNCDDDAKRNIFCDDEGTSKCCDDGFLTNEGFEGKFGSLLVITASLDHEGDNERSQHSIPDKEPETEPGMEPDKEPGMEPGMEPDVGEALIDADALRAERLMKSTHSIIRHL